MHFGKPFIEEKADFLAFSHVYMQSVSCYSVAADYSPEFMLSNYIIISL